MRLVAANGIESACEITGAGPPLVLCHGGEADHRNFYNFAPLLAEQFTVIAYDQRDTGQTRNGTFPYAIADLGRDVGGLIAALGYERAHVFGTSYGGVIAQEAVLQCPDRIDSLILGSTWAGGELHVTEDFLALARSEKSPSETRYYWKWFFSEAFGRSHPDELVDRMAKVVTFRTPEQRTRRGQGAFAHDARSRLPSVERPTLVIAGAEDRIVSADQSRKLAALIPGAKLSILENLGHATTIEAPERMAAEVRRFLLSD
jgi:pimeloyl-ACP methyl ester carboxylesterase